MTIENILNKSLALFFLILTFPLLIIISLLIKLTSDGPILFKQRRVGKDQKIFTILKFRTMVKNAEALKKKYTNQNEIEGPAFKIGNDPRYTFFGKFLSLCGLDEALNFLMF